MRIVWVGVIKRHLVCHMAFLDFFSWARIDKLSILEFITMKNRRKQFLKVQGVSFCPQKMCLQKTLKTYRNLENTVRNYWCLRCFRDKKPVVLFFREFLCFETSSCFCMFCQVQDYILSFRLKLLPIKRRLLKPHGNGQSSLVEKSI